MNMSTNFPTCPEGSHTLIPTKCIEKMGRVTILHDVVFHSVQPILRTFKIGSPSLQKYLRNILGYNISELNSEIWSKIQGVPFVAEVTTGQKGFMNLKSIMKVKGVDKNRCACPNHVSTPILQSTDLKSSCLIRMNLAKD